MTTELTPAMLAATQAFDDTPIFWRDRLDAARLVFKAVFFFAGGGTEAGQLAALSALADVAAVLGPNLARMQLPDPKSGFQPFDLGRLRDEGARQIRDNHRTARRPEDVTLDLLVQGHPAGGKRGSPAPFGGSVVGYAPVLDTTNDISVLEYSTTLMWDAPNGFRRHIDLARHVARQIKALHGLAGFGVQTDRIDDSSSAEAATFPIVRRFDGVHCSLDHSFAVEQALRRPAADRYFSINWLTILGEDMADALGGGQVLAAKVGTGCPVHPYDNGVILQAGDGPQPGDSNRGLVLDDYRRVNEATRAVRFEDYGVGLFPVAAPLDSLDETLRWVKRFD